MTIEPRWPGACVVVAASGPSLTSEVAEQCRGVPCLVVNDAYKLMPWAEVLYAADWKWWKHHNGCPDFAGEKWVPKSGSLNSSRDVQKQAAEYGLRLVNGDRSGGFSRNPSLIHYGLQGACNSGFQAVGLAILFGAARIILVGFDMREVGGKKHFFGSHPKGLNPNQAFSGWIRGFADAVKTIPAGVSVVNATPDSALKCFPMMSLTEALECREAA